MAASVSNEVLEAMGLRRLGQSETISARFHYLHVFEVRGFTVEELSLPIRSGRIDGRTYEIGVGASVNAVCRSLVRDDLADDEQEWQMEHKCTPPYVVVHLGPTKEYSFNGTHAKFEASMVHTYDGFSEARAELKAWGEGILPPLLTGLASSFALHDQPVKFLPTDRAFYGITEVGQTVLDTRLVFSGSGYSSSRLTPDQVADRLESANEIAVSVKQKVARFFNLALNEDDPLKRFLYFFLAVEIETHATFARIDHSDRLRAFIQPPSHATATTQSFFDGQSQKWTNLRDRFVWCVMCAWPHLTDDDVEQFKMLKAIRDEIAHGSLATPPHDAAASVEKLAARLQLGAL